MALETYKKVSIAVIVLSIAAVIVIATSNTNQKREVPATERNAPAAPAGPMVGADPAMDASAFPDDPKKLAAIGDSFFEKQSFAQAVIVYEKAIKLNPDDVDTYNDLGLAYLYTGKTEQAIETIKKGTEVDPKYQRIWLTLGFSLLSQKRPVEGKKALEKAYEINPDTTIGKEAKRMLGTIKQ